MPKRLFRLFLLCHADRGNRRPRLGYRILMLLVRRSLLLRTLLRFWRLVTHAHHPPPLVSGRCSGISPPVSMDIPSGRGPRKRHIRRRQPLVCCVFSNLSRVRWTGGARQPNRLVGAGAVTAGRGRRKDPIDYGPSYRGIASIRRNTRGGMNHNRVPLQASKSSTSISATPPLR